MEGAGESLAAADLVACMPGRHGSDVSAAIRTKAETRGEADSALENRCAFCNEAITPQDAMRLA